MINYRFLACDTSLYELGAVVSHRMQSGEEKPVGYTSRTLSKAERNYSPLTHIFNESSATPSMASGRIQRWGLTLGGYDYLIQYREGKNMANADALGRLPLKTSPVEVPRPPELVHVMEHLDSTPLTCTQIRIWTDHDLLSRGSGSGCKRVGQLKTRQINNLFTNGGMS